MKYGELFENESVPEWSLHNIDYNSLKHYIKARTTKGQATAIAIPGHQDAALKKFEDDFYAELCHQHARVGLFVTSKAEELSRRLQHLSDGIHNTLRRCARRQISPRRQRRFAKYAQEAAQCGDEIQDLDRFVNAQVIAFRKILKKYKKWTGSQSLGRRFRENVLSDPKSFTNRDFHQLRTQYEDLISELQAVTLEQSPRPESPPIPDDQVAATDTPRRRSVQFQETPLVKEHRRQDEPSGYWNEYDYGSDAGEEAAYTIYVDPEEDTSLQIPALSSLIQVLAKPIEAVRGMLSVGSGAGERRPLLPSHRLDDARTHPAAGAYESLASYGSLARHLAPDRDAGISPTTTPAMSDGYSAEDEENMDVGSDEDFPRGYDARFAALPSINEQRVARYRDRVLFWGTVAGNATSLVLLGVAGLLMMTGRHRLRVEVDAGVIVGVMTSLAAACAALGMTLARNQDSISWVNSLAVYVTFAVICVLNGMLLILVMGNSPLQ